MSDIKEEILFQNSGLDHDSDSRYILKGDSKYRLNVVSTDNGSTYNLTNIKGTKKYSHSFTHETPTYDGAVYTCIGDYYDVTRNAVYLFSHSTLGNHSVLRFSHDNQSWDKVVFDSLYLGFDINYPITDAFMIDNYLFYNPRTSSPRMVNVKWCTNYFDYDFWDDPATYDIGDKFNYKGKVFESLVDGLSGADAQTDILAGTFASVNWTGDRYVIQNNEYFYNYPYQPIISPVCEYGSDTNKNINNLKGKLFQFAYRYVYGDGRASLYSPYSIIQGQATGVGYDGDNNDSIQDDNKLTIDVRYLYDFGWNYEYYLDYVDIVFRESDSAGWGDWKLAGQLDWVDVINDNDFTFYNDKNFLTVDNIEVATPNYALPVTTKSQWSLDGKRIAYGSNVDSYNTPAPDVTLSELFEEQVANQNGTVLDDTYTVTETAATVTNDYLIWTEYSYEILIPSTSTAGYSVEITVNGQEAYLLVDGAWSLTQYRTAIQDLMFQNFTNGTVTANGVSYSANRLKSTVTAKVYSTATGLYTRQYGFKSGASHKFCLFYYDVLMRRSAAIESEDLSIYLPFITEQTITNAGYIYNQSVAFEINHRPPSWARYWKIGYSGNTTVDRFWQYTISAITLTNVANSEEFFDMTGININSLQEHKTVTSAAPITYSFPNSTIDVYDYQEGDRIRFITNSDGSAPTPVPLTTYYDYEIKGYKPIGTSPTVEWIFIDELASSPIGSASVVEIYRPKKGTTETVYYETDKLYTVYADSGTLYHKGEEQSQTSAQPAKVTVSRGDIYYLTRLFSLPVNAASSELYAVESFSYSDYAETEVWGQGKTGGSSDIGQTDNTSIVYSNQFFDTKGVNGLSEFNGLDTLKLSSQFGDIIAMRQVGGTLRVYFERNSASIYVNKAQFYNEDGTSQIIKSDNILSQPNYSPYLYGTIFPESVRMVDRHVYFFDIYRGCFVRDSSNGMVPISGIKGSTEANYKMSTYFKEKALALRESGVTNISVKTAWDEEHGLVFVAFEDSSDVRNNETLAFHEGSNRWISFYDISNFRYDDYVYSENASKLSYVNNVTLDSYTSVGGGYQTIGSVASGASDPYLYTTLTYTYTQYDKAKITISDNESELAFDVIINSVTVGSVAVGENKTFEYVVPTAGSYGIKVEFTTDDNTFDFVIKTEVASVISTTIEWLGGGGDKMVGYDGEDVYLHGDTTVNRNYLYDTQRNSIVDVVGVEAPNVIKSFDSMAIHSNKPWDVTDITIPATATYPNGMQSKIPETRFKRREGVYYSDYLRNMFSSSSTALTLDLMRGDQLRGYTITNRLENDDTSEVNLFKVDINSSASKV